MKNLQTASIFGVTKNTSGATVQFFKLDLNLHAYTLFFLIVFIYLLYCMIILSRQARPKQ